MQKDGLLPLASELDGREMGERIQEGPVISILRVQDYEAHAPSLVGALFLQEQGILLTVPVTVCETLPCGRSCGQEKEGRD